MVPVLPMLVPEDIGIEARNDQCRNNHAIDVSSLHITEGAPPSPSALLRGLLD